MRKSILYGGIIGLGLALSACSNSEVKSLREQVDTQAKTIADLDQRLKQQEEFSNKAKEVLAEHRTHIQGIEDMIAKSKGVRRPAKHSKKR
jgi:septal ring factor EnvC (AmiA/AmiB activator)